MKRRTFLISAAAMPLRAAAPRALLMLTPEDAARMRAALAKNDRAAAPLRKAAAAAMSQGPWSVASHRPRRMPPDLKPNDYYSEGPYWWPDPKNPSGPYIRKDGERYPGRFVQNRLDIAAMSECVLALGIAAHFFKDGRAADRAARVLDAWFLDPRTRMNPHLEFGQAVIGRNTGRGAGQIETVSLIQAAQGITLLGAYDTGLRDWFAAYLKWMTTSEKGLAEKQASNNHATWWTAQVAAFGAFTGNDEARNMAYARYREFLVPKQVRPDGSCPAEEARTRSLSYSSMNLDGFSTLCRLAEVSGVDLWRSPVEKAYRYLLPYVLQPATWKKPQITGYEQDRVIFPGLAGLGLRSGELLAAYRRLPRAEAPWIQFIDLLVRTATATA
ncbi:MAG: alginate lyase family protein [Bryobacteraceae bacterium]